MIKENIHTYSIVFLRKPPVGKFGRNDYGFNDNFQGIKENFTWNLVSDQSYYYVILVIKLCCMFLL